MRHLRRHGRGNCRALAITTGCAQITASTFSCPLDFFFIKKTIISFWGLNGVKFASACVQASVTLPGTRQPVKAARSLPARNSVCHCHGPFPGDRSALGREYCREQKEADSPTVCGNGGWLAPRRLGRGPCVCPGDAIAILRMYIGHSWRCGPTGLK